MNLTREEVLKIPSLLEEMTQEEASKELGVHKQTVVYWVRKLKKEGILKKQKRGRKPIKLK